MGASRTRLGTLCARLGHLEGASGLVGRVRLLWKALGKPLHCRCLLISELF